MMLAALTAAFMGLFALPALADSAQVTADLNMRAGPGTEYPVIRTIPHGGDVDVYGCVRGYTWCDVSWAGRRGWVSARYLDYYYEQRRSPIATLGPVIGLPVISYSYNDYWSRHYRGRSWYRGPSHWDRGHRSGGRHWDRDRRHDRDRDHDWRRDRDRDRDHRARPRNPRADHDRDRDRDRVIRRAVPRHDSSAIRGEVTRPEPRVRPQRARPDRQRARPEPRRQQPRVQRRGNDDDRRVGGGAARRQ